MAAEHVRALGERIRLRREELGLTQDEVARQMSGTVDGQRISKWERGENRPRDESLEDLARVLKTSALALLAPEPEKTTTPDLSKPPAIEGELAQVLADIKAQLKEQTDVLRGIQASIKRENKARADADEATKRLLAVVDEFRPALRGEAQAPVEEPEQPAK